MNITIGENERVYFQVSGTHSIFLTGNYVEPAHDHEHGHGEDDDEYDSEEDLEESDYDSEDDEEGEDEEIEEFVLCTLDTKSVSLPHFYLTT